MANLSALGYRDFAAELRKISDDDLRASGATAQKARIKRNTFRYFLKRLGKSMATGHATTPGSVPDSMRLSPGSQVSASSDEDKNEQVSRTALIDFIEELVDDMPPLPCKGDEFLADT